MQTYPDQIHVKPAIICRLAFQAILLVTLGVILTACKDETTGSARADATGVYELVTVNGNKVPASVSHDGATLQVRSGTFTINADGTCGTKTVFVPPNGSEMTREVSATYKQDGSKLTMQWKGAGTTVGTIEGKSFTMNNEGMVLVYTK